MLHQYLCMGSLVHVSPKKNKTRKGTVCTMATYNLKFNRSILPNCLSNGYSKVCSEHWEDLKWYWSPHQKCIKEFCFLSHTLKCYLHFITNMFYSLNSLKHRYACWIALEGLAHIRIPKKNTVRPSHQLVRSKGYLCPRQSVKFQY